LSVEASTLRSAAKILWIAKIRINAIGKVQRAATSPPAKAPNEFHPVSPYCGAVRMFWTRTDLSVKYPITADSTDAETKAMPAWPHPDVGHFFMSFTAFCSGKSEYNCLDQPGGWPTLPVSLCEGAPSLTRSLRQGWESTAPRSSRLRAVHPDSISTVPSCPVA
jgi:hypothetical protein